ESLHAVLNTEAATGDPKGCKSHQAIHDVGTLRNRDRHPGRRVDENVCGGSRYLAVDRKSTRLNSSHVSISYAVFCLKKKIICVGLVSAISSMTWIGPRVTMSMGEDHWLLRLLGRKNGQGVPTNAIVFQLLIVNLFLL